MAAAVKLNLRRQPPSYGIDAPGLVRTFFVTGALALIVALSAGHFPWPGGLVAGALSALAGFVSAYALGMGCSMLYGSLVAKVRGRDQLLGLVPWSGSEAVLDRSCRGDRPLASQGPIRQSIRSHPGQLPYAAASFEVVVSHWVVHNLDTPTDRARALEEMARVLKPGGWLLIADIEHHGEYVHRLNDLGFVGVRHVVSRFWDQVRGFITFGTFRPGTVIGQKVVAPSVA